MMLSGIELELQNSLDVLEFLISRKHVLTICQLLYAWYFTYAGSWTSDNVVDRR